MKERKNAPLVLRQMSGLIWILFFLSIRTSAQSSRTRLKYSDVSHLGNDCRSVDSCGYKRTSGSRGLESVQEMNCACDYMCAAYHDCCIDAPVFNDVPTINAGMRSDWKCYELRQFGGVYMKDACPIKSGDQEIVDLCENIDPEDFSDPIISMPVTDSESGLTYRNFYCGVCNGNKDNLVFWTPRLECPTLTLYNSSRKNLTLEYVSQNLVFDGINWGIYLDGDNGSSFFHDCIIDPVMPLLLQSKIRLCKGQFVSECAKDWDDHEVKTKCESYTGLRYYHSESYRNVHCALCNHVNVSLLTCQPVEYREVIFRTFAHRSFSLLLDINEQGGRDVGLLQRCNKDELFDPFFKRCRSLTCLPGSVRKGGNCVSEFTPTTAQPTHDPLARSTSISNTSKIAEVNITQESSLVSNGDLKSTSPGKAQSVTVIFTNITDGSNLVFNNSVLENHSDLEKGIGRLNCSLISLSEGDYVMYQNKTVYVAEYGKKYEPTNYFALDGSILICSPFDDQQEVKFSPVMGYVTVAGLGISMFCLFLHFLTFCIVPDLRNLSGKNLMSQCISLFFAYCWFITGQGQLNSQVCTVAAFFTIYFFEASFFWMSIMAFDVWRTLKMATTELRVTSGRQLKRFFLYSMYAWLLPLFLLAAVAVAEYTEAFPEEYRPRFASPRCWFKRRRALLCFFAVPLFSVILSNIILYASSAKMIIMTTQTTVKQQNTAQKRNFKLYLRLFILMGLTWAVGLIAAWVDSEVMWYLFIFLNTLQGLFIFLSFTCSSKVLCYLRDRASKFTKAADFRSTASHSTSHSASNSNSTTALTNVSIRPNKLWAIKKHSASPTNSSASNCSKR